MARYAGIYIPVHNHCSSHAVLSEDLRRERWAAFPELGGLLEGVGELQHAEVVAVATDDLQADREPFGREAGGDRDRGVAGDGDVVAALHPVEVVAHAHAGDLARPFLLDREGRQLVYGAQKEVVALQEPPHAVKQVAAQRLRAGDFLRRELQSFLDVPDDGVLEFVAVLLEVDAVALQEAERAQGLEGFGGAGEIGLGFFQYAAKILEHFLLSGQGGGDAIVHRQAAQVAAPGDANFLEFSLQTLRKDFSRLGDRHRRARVGAGHGRQEKGAIVHGARHRADYRQRVPGVRRWPRRYPPWRRPEADDVAVVAGIAQARREV